MLTQKGAILWNFRATSTQLATRFIISHVSAHCWCLFIYKNKTKVACTGCVFVWEIPYLRERSNKRSSESINYIRGRQTRQQHRDIYLYINTAYTWREHRERHTKRSLLILFFCSTGTEREREWRLDGYTKRLWRANLSKQSKLLYQKVWHPDAVARLQIPGAPKWLLKSHKPGYAQATMQ